MRGNRLYRKNMVLFFTMIFVCSMLQFLPIAVFAGGIPQAQYHTPQGSGAPRSSGDYITATLAHGGLNTVYRYFIEVPPGLTSGSPSPRLQVEVFDGDIGAGGAGETVDRSRSGWNTSVTYRVFNPLGVQQSAQTCSNSNTNPFCQNNAWAGQPYNNPMPGHWEFRVDMSSAVTNGDAINGFAVRAYVIRGSYTPELNMYAKSFVELGAHPVTGNPYYDSRSFTLYPYITSGCTAATNDFDCDANVDSNNPNTCSISYTSRTGTFTHTNTNYSGNNTWQHSLFGLAASPSTPWTNDFWSYDYGIWSLTSSINTYDNPPGTINGNYETFYMEDFNGTGPPPINNNPQANTLRLYLPTDAGTAPVKPYLTQTAIYVSGSNPPVSGSTTRIRVQVTMNNPTVFPITFSTPTNLVIASLPGNSQVHYVGSSASVTQGTVTEPGGGATTGNITWNPGTVAAGTSPSLTYELDVTPTGTSRIPVTATPASGNGTRAIFVDETCSGASPACSGTQLTNATFTFGPLCELAVTAGTWVPTLVTISSFGAYEDSGKVIVEWDTASEINTVGFYLFRKDGPEGEYLQVNEELLPGLMTSPQGGTYRYIDGTALPGSTYTYKLVEIETKGRKRTYGPFTVTIGNKAASFSTSEQQITTFSSKAHGLQSARKARILKANVSMRKASSISPVNGRVKITVTENGIYYLNASDIASLMGITANEVQGLIQKTWLLLSNNGQKIAYLPSADNSKIYFYGEGTNSIFTSETVYWLEKGMGVSIKSIGGRGPVPAGSTQSFTEKLHIEKDLMPATGLFSDPRADFWLWDFIVAGPSGSSTPFEIPVHGVASSGQASLAVHLKGATDIEGLQDHHAVIYLNGHQIGETKWDGTEAKNIELPFDQSILNEGNNIVTVTGFCDSGVAYSVFYINSFDLTYQRYYHAVDNRLFLRGDGNPVVTVDGFTNSDIFVFDVTTPVVPQLITAVTIDADRVSFRTASPDARYFVLTADKLSFPVSITAGITSALKDRRNGADYIIIAPSELIDDDLQSLNRLSDYRKRQGFKTMVVDLKDIMDEFNYGIYSPKAIKDFLSYAYKNWSTAPGYVLLAGKGTFDYKNILGAGGNLCPVALTATPDGLFPSDNYYADMNGDHVPEIAIGRLPVVSTEELQDVIGKIIAYETTASGDCTKSILMLADDSDEGGNFSADSDNVASLLPQVYTAHKIYLPDNPTIDDIDEVRRMVMNGIDNGVFLLNYIGHGGLDRLAQEGMLLTSDVASMTNGILPVVTAMTCVVGNFAYPGFDSLGEVLLLKKDGGAAAVWSPTGLSVNTEAVKLDKAFFTSAFRNSMQPLGDIVLNALKQGRSNGVSGYILDIYNIIGDPALRLK